MQQVPNPTSSFSPTHFICSEFLFELTTRCLLKKSLIDLNFLGRLIGILREHTGMEFIRRCLSEYHDKLLQITFRIIKGLIRVFKQKKHRHGLLSDFYQILLQRPFIHKAEEGEERNECGFVKDREKNAKSG